MPLAWLTEVCVPEKNNYKSLFFVHAANSDLNNIKKYFVSSSYNVDVGEHLCANWWGTDVAQKNISDVRTWTKNVHLNTTPFGIWRLTCHLFHVAMKKKNRNGIFRDEEVMLTQVEFLNKLIVCLWLDKICYLFILWRFKLNAVLVFSYLSLLWNCCL